MQHNFEAQYNFKTHEFLKIRDEYVGITANREQTVGALQSKLVAYALGQPLEKRTAFRQKSQDFKSWIEKKSERADLESFETKSRELKELLAKAKNLPPRAPASIS